MISPVTAKRSACRPLFSLVMAAVGLVVLLAAPAARAEEDFEAGDVATYAIEKRLFRTGLELGGGIGILPMNAFSKGLIAEGAVTWHMSSTWGWEIIQGGYVFANLETGLKKELLQNFGVEPTQLPSASFILSSNLVFTPFYGKIAGLNRSVNHIELFFPFGVAVARYLNPGLFKQGPDLGVGLRWYLGTHTSLRLDARDYLVFQSFKNFSLTNELMFSLGLSVAWGGAER
jgi:outer membrane beta-barrel protein